MSKVTPNKKTLSSKGGSSSNKKQLSLMAFFKPAGAKENTEHAASSSPLKNKNHSESDKENDVMSHTLLTSELERVSKVLTDMLSSPIKSRADPGLMNSGDPAAEVTMERPTEPENIAASSPTGTKGARARKSVSYAEEDDSEEDEIPVGRKRRRPVQSDNEDSDFTPDPTALEPDDHMSDFIAEESDESIGENSALEHEDSVSKNRGRKKVQRPGPASVKEPSSSLGSKFLAGSSYVSTQKAAVPKTQTKPTTAKKNFEKENEERYQWLVNIKDAEKHSPDHPDYDSRTLYIPSSAWAKFTAFEKQYWEIKAKMWDTVVFFKKGKFYELYENDAMIANSQFDLKIAGGGRANMRLAGVPEMSFEYWAKEFISHGYKVAKVDQKESMLAKEMRGGGCKEEKIIKRELTGILTGGTLTDMDMIKDDMATYCMSIKESTSERGEKVFGVCFVDTATSELNFIELVDDDECTKLDTLITQIKPKEILCEKHNLCSTASKIIKFNAHNTHQIWNHLNPYSEFWDYDTTLETLVKARYYNADDLDDFSNYPPPLLQLKDNCQVAFNAFGGLLYYLKTLKLDESIMTMGNMKEYKISKSSATHMLLDGITLNNLEVLNNSFDGGDKGTLFKLINRAITPFGKRMIKTWVLHPLMQVEQINKRLDAVDFLMHNEPELRVSLESSLHKLPDLERLISRVHSKTLAFKDFLKVIEGFENVSKMFNGFSDFDLEKSGMLQEFVGYFPSELHAIISSWEDAFDRVQALQNVVVPAEGVDAEFDESTRIINNLELQLNDHLRSYKKQFKSQEICFKDSGKELYLIEMSTKIKNVPKDWQQMGATSKVKRYWSPEVKKLVRELMEQKELHKTVCESIRSRLYGRFDVNYKTWVKVIKAVSSIDCLIALTKTSESIGYPSCRPTFRTSGEGFISFKELRHPCFVGSSDFIPNDINLGGVHANFGLLTGANAAGKSTLMRTTALATMLAQIGCYIPAEKAELCPVDKIMTRLGANDNIIQGKSTFFVELSETKKILSNATPNSLVILDELGRGGSSSDGFAIAESVLHHLSTHVQPLGFFATHYGSLGLAFTNHPQIRPLRMGIIVDSDSRNITFLYKLEDGTAPGSFGMNVAAMCGISSEIVDAAEAAAKKYEQTSRLKDTHKKQRSDCLSLGLQSDFAWLYGHHGELEKDVLRYEERQKKNALKCMFEMIGHL